MAAKILAVDDESDVLLIVKTGLQSEGFEVVTATNGPDALEAVGQENPDLVVLDVMMPGMDGFEVLRHIKSNDETAHIPVIMLTGLSERAKIQEALVSGTDYYLVKPFDFMELIQKVRTALNDAGV